MAKTDPYCDIDGCHDVRTTFYAWTGTGFGPYYGLQGSGSRYSQRDHLLCRIHALQRFRCAIGHRQFAYAHQVSA